MTSSCTWRWTPPSLPQAASRSGSGSGDHWCRRCPPSPSPLSGPSLGPAMNPSRDMDMARTVADTASPSVVPWISCLNRQPDPVTYNHMVVGELANDAIDDLFRALADPTRRDIIRRAAAGEPSVSRLAQAYPMS